MDTEIVAVEKWGIERRVPVYCGEFGVYKNYSDPKMRVAWIRDTRTALERHHPEWAMGTTIVTSACGENQSRDRV